MPKKNFIPQKENVWIDARTRYQLSHSQIQMARELGMNPGSFSKLANHRQQPWKAPLPDFIEELYFQRFGKRQPDNVRTIEQVVKERRAKKEAKRQERSALKVVKQDQTTSQSECTEVPADDDSVVPF